MNNSVLKFIIIMFSLASLLKAEPIELKRYFMTMGTVLELSICGEEKELGIAFSRIENILEKFDNMANLFNSNSELSRLNRTASNKPFYCSKELYELLKIAQESYKKSDGLFDITAKPLMDLWGFYRKRQAAPTKSEITETLKIVGLNKVIFDDQNKSIFFTQKGMAIDLGGIAKGYALDCIYKEIKPLTKYGLINLGGNIMLIPCDGKVYNIGIKEPTDQNKIAKILNLSSGAISTSGSYEKYIIYQGKKYSHIINPLTGIPTLNRGSSTVVTPKGVDSDWMSTAIFLGGEKIADSLKKEYKDTLFF